MSKLNYFFLFFLFTISLFCQNENKKITVKYISEPIKIDGVLDEPVWGKAEYIDDFQQYFPSDTILAKQPTLVKILYDDTKLYISVKATTIGDNYVIPSLKRDYRAGGNDNITFLFDTFNDGTNAFVFGVNPYGVRREALIFNGGVNGGAFNVSWDVKWKGETKISDGFYTSEIAIPLTSFKFKEGEIKWRFNCYRFDMQSNERSTWAKIPQNQIIINLAFMGEMIFEKPLGKSKSPIAIIPYLNTISEKDYNTNETNTNFKVGGDAKIAIGNGMNLDVTVNPDFSNVEVDNVFTNLTRFEVSLPEKRQFFIDNSDLFSSFGGAKDANPFFSRRIGIAKDKDGNSIENDIIAGVRLSGKLNNDWRLGFLNIQTAEDIDNEVASNNNTMFAIQKRVFNRSNFGLFFINRQSFKDYDFVNDNDKYNRVFGIDYNLASEDNSWVGKFYAHKSFAHNAGRKDLSTGINLGYNSKNINVFYDGVYIGEDFRSDLGFIRRTDIVKMKTNFEYIFWPKAGPLNNHSFSFLPSITWSPEMDFKNTDYDIMTSWRAEFKNQTNIGAFISNKYTFLTSAFDPTNSDGAIPLPANQGYYYNSIGVNYESDKRKVVSYSLESSLGQFYNGDAYSFEGEIALRIQPKASFLITANYNKINLPKPYESANLWLLSPKIDITFSKSIFWSSLIQYSNQRDNLGVNSRLQWRYAPLSDLFIVYNDNYYVNNFEPKYRSINLKFTYWFSN